MILGASTTYISNRRRYSKIHIPKKWAERAPRFVYDSKRRAQTWPGRAVSRPRVSSAPRHAPERGVQGEKVPRRSPRCAQAVTTAGRVPHGCRRHPARWLPSSPAGRSSSRIARIASSPTLSPGLTTANRRIGGQPPRPLIPLRGARSGRRSSRPRSEARRAQVAHRDRFSEAPESSSIEHPQRCWDPFSQLQEEDVTLAIPSPEQRHAALPFQHASGVASTLRAGLGCMRREFLWCKSLVKYPNVKGRFEGERRPGLPRPVDAIHRRVG